ncbi:MAG TPA: RNA 2',3'-cyclic phosphodiesterase [Candidatus Acidoferrales bacterium]|nr:RNA 2',3'-cyclic phosphodiesterase [Candidatus Acidoferrales bacterium]
MRLFVALDLDDNIRSRIARFLDGVQGFAPGARWLRPDSLHVTLKFIGEQTETQVEIERALAGIQADQFVINLRGYGFFPDKRAPRVFWIGIDGGSRLTSLAETVDSVLVPLQIPNEEHAYSPHLTLARSARASGSPRQQSRDRPNQSFQRLQEKLSALPEPEFGTMTAREFFLYRSQLSPGGSKYTKLAGFNLR